MSDNYNIKPDEWINARMAKQPYFKPRIQQERVDPEVSYITGKKVLINDSRLIKKLAEWKKQKNPDEPDNFLKDPRKVEEIKKLFND